MQFLAINNDVTLSQLAARVGSRNVDDVLQTNGVKRTHRVGSAYNVTSLLIAKNCISLLLS